MIRVASYQATPANTFSKRKKQILTALKEADKNGIDFLCFPEGFLTGYFEKEEKTKENCLCVAESSFQGWLHETRPYRVTAIVGFNEREGSNLFNSAAMIEKGQLIGVQRKHYLYHNYFSQGCDFTVYRSKGVTFGVVICLDMNYFEPSRLLSLQGAAILFSPMCNKVSLDHAFAERPSYYSHFIARAHENRCWVVASDWIWPNDGEIIPFIKNKDTN